MAPESTPSPAGFAKPSFSSLDRVGRDGYLRLGFQQRFGRTILGRCLFRLPLQALTPVELDDGTAYLMLLNPTGGLVGGDCLLTQIVLEAGTRVCLTTPSATRVYRTLAQPAVQETRIQVGEGARLEYLPDHVIPHENSKLRQSLQVEMGPGSRAIVWDALAAGRIARGERWKFHEVDSSIEISLNGQLLFCNRARIQPSQFDPVRLGLAQEFTYVATLVVAADGWRNWEETVAALRAELANIPRVYAGVSALTTAGCVAKLLAQSASDLLLAQTRLWRCTRQIVFGSPPVDLRKY